MDKLSQTQIQNYTLISKVGQGASAEVILAKQNQTKTLCVLKMIQKNSLIHQEDEQRVVQESQALKNLLHPFLVKIYQAFQTRKHYCIALEYCPGGDLYTHLHMSESFNEQKISFYAAQLVLALQYLHEHDIIFRDLKPENIMIDKDGYLKLIDFGMSKSQISNDDFRTFSICGTSQYTAPQMIEKQGHGKAFDWWTLGCCLYEMVHKISPFYSDDRTEMYEKILNDEPVFTENVSQQLIDLIQGLLQKNPQKRMAFAKTIKTHEFFAGINFQKILSKQYLSPYVPEYARGKKMLKVIKDEVQQFTNFEDCETFNTKYLKGFDYNCGQHDQSTVETEDNDHAKLSKQGEQKQLTQKQSTQDDQDDPKEQVEVVVKKYKSFWNYF